MKLLMEYLNPMPQRQRDEFVSKFPETRRKHLQAALMKAHIGRVAGW